MLYIVGTAPWIQGKNNADNCGFGSINNATICVVPACPLIFNNANYF